MANNRNFYETHSYHADVFNIHNNPILTIWPPPSTKVPTFHFELTTTEATQNAFIDTQRREIVRCQLNILTNVLMERTRLADTYHSACQTSSVLKTLLERLLVNAYDMHGNVSYQVKFVEQYLLAMNYGHLQTDRSTMDARLKQAREDSSKKAKAIAAAAPMEIDPPAVDFDAIHRTTKKFASVYSEDPTSDRTKHRNEDPTKDRTKPHANPRGRFPKKNHWFCQERRREKASGTQKKGQT
ncbi:hypothetical protein INT44_002735 [Umbelopsis vinacea]|uniref:Uncharacterized protein n=1 Tax=Umbelopsis vinacea TaxID=44442 RepID=A0A8H7Q603_9FUNG|nr:hypothetical protein INT44_002735 [Umbelopsis vinacea]